MTQSAHSQEALPTATLASLEGTVAVCSAIAIERFLSAELFRDLAGQASGSAVASMAEACYQRWLDLAGVLAAMPSEIESVMVLGAHAGESIEPTSHLAFLPIGRGAGPEKALAACTEATTDLARTLAAHLDYAEVAVVDDADELRALVGLLDLPHAHEVSRRWVDIRVSQDTEKDPIGFVVATAPPNGDADIAGGDGDGVIRHLYPWLASDDTWRRLLTVLRGETGSAALAVHVLGGITPEPRVADEIRSRLAWLEGMRPEASKAVLEEALEVLRHEMLQQLVGIEGDTLAVRAFVLSEMPPSRSLLAGVARAIDDVSASRELHAALPLLRGGAAIRAVSSTEVLARPNPARQDHLFDPREATSLLRTPMPGDTALPGFAISRARTAPFTGRSGADCALGSTNHRGQRRSIHLSESSRFRHVYLIGQTGTGKSTLMAGVALHDITRGRGVAVLDPHGSLNDAILRRLPPERVEDVVVLDVADTEHPIGFNVLRLDETDDPSYRVARDLLIDELFAYVMRTYSYVPQAMGPIFETHFRGMLALLLGPEPQREPFVPNLMLFRPLYTSEAFLAGLTDRMAGRDPVIDEFVEEVRRITSTNEHSLQNLASYVTSKLSRFISDAALRNMTCQRSMLDIAQIVDRQKIVLFYLRRGRFGEYAAGLLASQMVARLRDAVMRRGAESGRPPFYLYVDEFQTIADERTAEMLSEARKFGMAMTLAHQFAAQLPPSVLQAVIGNVGTSVLFRIGAADAAALETVVAPTFRARDLVSLDNYRAYVRGTDDLGMTPFSMDTRPLDPSESDEIARAAIAHSRATYARPRSIVESEIRETYTAYRLLG